MGSVAASEPVVRFAWATGLLCVGLSLALVLQVVRMRWRLARRRRRREAAFAAWRPILFEVAAGQSPKLPALAPRDEDAFLFLWVQLMDGIRGAPLARLAAAGEAVGARALALRRLRGRADQMGHILALRTLGYLRRPEDRGEVLRWLDEPRPYVSLAAAQALVHLDPGGAADAILPRLPAREDWPIPLVAKVLEEASRERLAVLLRALGQELPAPALVRLLPLASLLEARVAGELLAPFLEASDPEVISAALRQVRTPALLPAVRRAAVHPRWSVRVQGAAALGRVGEASDRELLLKMTWDPEWWVRYRAAQALVFVAGGAADEVAALAAGMQDRFARDMVQQVLAEVRA